MVSYYHILLLTRTMLDALPDSTGDIRCSAERASGHRGRWIFIFQAMVLFLTVFPLRAQDQCTQSSAQGTSNAPQGSAPNLEELAKEEKNPLSDLTQVQLGNNFDFGGDKENSLQYTMTLQPTIPIKLNKSWYLVTRANFSVSSMPESDSGKGRITGSSDLDAEFYFSPQKTTRFIWGFGPALGIPTASDASLGTGKWTLGPAFAIVKQTGHWTYGVDTYHLWSFAGDKNRGKVSSTFIQPVLDYTWGHGWTVGVDVEATYDSMALSGDRWTVPVQPSISKVMNLLKQPVSFSLGVIPYAVAPAGSPSMAINLTITALFPSTR